MSVLSLQPASPDTQLRTVIPRWKSSLTMLGKSAGVGTGELLGTMPQPAARRLMTSAAGTILRRRQRRPWTWRQGRGRLVVGRGLRPDRSSAGDWFGDIVPRLPPVDGRRP